MYGLQKITSLPKTPKLGLKRPLMESIPLYPPPPPPSPFFLIFTKGNPRSCRFSNSIKGKKALFRLFPPIPTHPPPPPPLPPPFSHFLQCLPIRILHKNAHPPPPPPPPPPFFAIFGVFGVFGVFWRFWGFSPGSYRGQPPPFSHFLQTHMR